MYKRQVETAEAWQIAIESCQTPTVLCLSRQNLSTVRSKHVDANMTAKGAYILRDVTGARDVTLIATGSEVEIALHAADLLSRDGIKAVVVSAPSFELFALQSTDYRKTVLGDAPRVGVEAAASQGWGEILGCKSIFVGMSGFGASAPADQLYEHFGITPTAVARAAKNLLRPARKNA